jgi:hypothetical protein
MPVSNQGKKQFDIQEYDALPVEKRSEYIKNTYAAPAKTVVPVQQSAINVEGEMKARQPVTQQKVEQLKKEFSLQPQPAPVAPAAPAPVPTQTAQKKEEPKKEQGFDWKSLLPALAPLATEALMSGGGTAGESLGISGKYILDEESKKQARKDALDTKLLELESKRELASIKAKGKEKPLTTSNVLPYVAEDGKVRYRLVSEALEEEKPMDQQKGLTMEQREKLQSNAFRNRMTIEDRKEGVAAGARFQQRLDQDKEYQGLKSQITNSEKAIEYLAQGANIADVGIKRVFAKGIFGDVGNLAVQEQADIAGAPDIYSRYLTLKTKFNKGLQFSDQDRAQLMEFALMIRNKAPKKLESLVNQRALAEKGISGHDVSKIASTLYASPYSGDIMVKVQIGKDVYEVPAAEYPSAVRKYEAKIYTGRK